jgi:hypothetical protein
MYEKKLIKPAKGMTIPLPDGNGNLPAEGKVQTLSTYWHRLEQEGDVTFEDVPAEPVQPDPADAVTTKSSKSK